MAVNTPGVLQLSVSVAARLKAFLPHMQAAMDPCVTSPLALSALQDGHENSLSRHTRSLQASCVRTMYHLHWALEPFPAGRERGSAL